MSIEGLRGVASGTLADLSRLVVLVGSNGSGKSTVLDALLMGSSPRPGDAVGRAVRRRWEQSSIAEWLFHRRAGLASITVLGRSKEGAMLVRQTRLDWRDSERTRSDWGIRGAVQGGARPACAIGVVPRSSQSGPLLTQTLVFFFDDNSFQVSEQVEDWDGLTALTGETRLIDMRGVEFGARQIPEVYTDAVSEGRADAANELLRGVVPGLREARILVEHGRPIMHLVFEWGSVPLAMAGDGVRGLARLAFELAARPRGLVLVEEPEVHQHPRAEWESARAIVEAVRRDVQIVIATHSIELIDALVGVCEEKEALPHLTVYRLALADGQLGSTRFAGDEVRRARREIDMDLR